MPPLACCRAVSHLLFAATYSNVFARSMRSLQELDASSNMLTSISGSVGELPSLVLLDVAGNDLAKTLL